MSTNELHRTMPYLFFLWRKSYYHGVRLNISFIAESFLPGEVSEVITRSSNILEISDAVPPFS